MKQLPDIVWNNILSLKLIHILSQNKLQDINCVYMLWNIRRVLVTMQFKIFEKRYSWIQHTELVSLAERIFDGMTSTLVEIKTIHLSQTCCSMFFKTSKSENWFLKKSYSDIVWFGMILSLYFMLKCFLFFSFQLFFVILSFLLKFFAA